MEGFLLPDEWASDKSGVMDKTAVGMGLHNTVMSSKDKDTISLSASDEMIGAVKGKQVFSTANHILSIKGERCDNKRMRHHKWRESQGNC